MTNAVSEKVIGNVEGKTKDVHFYVQRKSILENGWDNITFETELVNIGGAMNLTSRVTVPVPSTYFFAFSAVKNDNPEHLTVSIQVNGKEYGRAHTEILSSGVQIKSTVSLAASFFLKAGEKVNMRVEYGGSMLDDESHHHTGVVVKWAHFTGWLVNEELTLA